MTLQWLIITVNICVCVLTYYAETTDVITVRLFIHLSLLRYVKTKSIRNRSKPLVLINTYLFF